MWPNPQFPADLVTFTEEIFNVKLHFTNDINSHLTIKLKGACPHNLNYFPRCFHEQKIKKSMFLSNNFIGFLHVLNL